MLKNNFCFGLNESEIICNAMIFFKYRSIDSNLTVQIVFAEKYIQPNGYIFNIHILQFIMYI